MLTTPGHPLLQTRTVTSTKLLSFLNVNLNYHLEHHLFPAVPWYNLPKVHTLLQEEYEQAGAFIYSSYLRFLVDAFRYGSVCVYCLSWQVTIRTLNPSGYNFVKVYVH